MDIASDGLIDDAKIILERMEPGHRYGSQELRAFVPHTSVERLREIMHELWIDRQVERAGDGGWRRVRSEPPHRRESAARETQEVTPEELFDHDTFAEFFK